MDYKTPDGALHQLDDGIDPASVPAFPQNAVPISKTEASAIRAAASALTTAQMQVMFAALIQERLDEFARSRNYDCILSACTYATSSVAKFKAEGQCCVALRDSTWSAAYTVLAQVQSGQRAMPHTISDISTDLPVLVWPA
jgi:hypothetical protein